MRAAPIASVVNGFDGAVGIRSATFNYATNILPFRWDPTPKPVVSQIVPEQAPVGNWVTLKGQRFTAYDQVFFVAENGAEIPTQMHYMSANELEARVPVIGGVQTAVRMIQVYVKSSVNNVAAKSNLAAFQLMPPPVINAFDSASGKPGMSLFISGAGFQNPVVHFIQPAGGPDYPVKPNPGEWNAGQIYVTLPDIPLIPINGMIVNVTVESSGQRSAPKNFTFMPLMDEKALNEITVQNFKQGDGRDQEGLGTNSAIGSIYLYVWRYCGDFFGFNSGTEIISPTVTLKNGWRLKQVVTHKTVAFEGVTANVNFPTIPTATSGDLTTKVDWWTRFWATGAPVEIFVSYIITGPKGVPYK